MNNHNYVNYITPVELLQYANNCRNTKYFVCSNCGMKLLSILEEIINGYERVYKDYYFINDKQVRWENFQGLTCEEIVIKLAVE